MSASATIAVLAAGVGLISVVFNLLILALALKFYTEYFKERVKGKDGE